MKVCELEAQFPYMFEGPHVGLVHYRGWFPVFASLCVAVNAVLGEDKRRFRWTRVDRHPSWEWSASFKYALDSPQDPLPGKSRAVLDPYADLTLYFVDALVEQAEAAASGACIVCGDSAKGVALNDALWKSCSKHRPPKGATKKQVDEFIRELRRQWLAE